MSIMTIDQDPRIVVPNISEKDINNKIILIDIRDGVKEHLYRYIAKKDGATINSVLLYGSSYDKYSNPGHWIINPGCISLIDVLIYCWSNFTRQDYWTTVIQIVDNKTDLESILQQSTYPTAIAIREYANTILKD